MKPRIAHLALPIMIAAATQAAGQNALGDGRKNDASLQQGSGGTNTAVNNDLQNSLSLRNAIVTGNAPGGMSFRGNLGYVGSREFRGELGSDDLFSFRRDSLYSGISGLGLRGTDALQYQFAMTTGSRPPSAIAGSLAISRDAFMPTVSGINTAVGSNATSTTGAIQRVDSAEQTNAVGAGLWRLRSSAGYITDKSLSSSYIGTINTGQGSYDLTASPLDGLRVIDPNAVSAQAMSSRNSSTANTTGRVNANSPQTSIGVAPISTGYQQIVDQLRGTYNQESEDGTGTEQDYVDRIMDQNAKIRAYIEGIRNEAIQNAAEAEPAEGQNNTETDTEDLTPEEKLLRDLESFNVDPAVIETLRQSNVMVERLVAGANPEELDYFAVHMNQGRDAMRTGNYFNAEARFSMALSIKPGDPTAAISRIHAQIGAGLTLSAGANLRLTLTENPTMITARYAAGLIPNENRMRDVAGKLQVLADGAGIEARQAALVLSYIGYQIRDDALVKEGLDRLELESNDRLAGLLRLMWLSDDKEPGAEGE
ncbi:MAG: hypothetical protein ACIARQ_00510 [Phycisphaerales bacterium JB061]